MNSSDTDDDRIAIIIPVKGRLPEGEAQLALRRKAEEAAPARHARGHAAGGRQGEEDRHTYVISSDNDILKFAERFGAGSIEEDKDRGVNEAVESAISELGDYDGWLIMPADLPMIRPNDIRTVLNLVRMGSSVVICPLGRLQRDEPAADEQERRGLRSTTTTTASTSTSRRRRRRGIRFSVYYSENVGFDIDNARDVHRYFRFGRRNSTMNFLARTLKRQQSVAPRAPKRRRLKGPRRSVSLLSS